MKRILPKPSRLLGRAAVSGAVAILSLAAAPLAAGATGAPTATVTSIAVSGDQITATWTLADASATQVDAQLYDSTGTLVEDDAFDPSVTTDTFYDVANGSGYYVVVEVTDPSGVTDSAASSTVSVAVDAPPTIDTITCSGGDLTVTWTSNAPDVTGYDVTLYDLNGDVVQDLTVSADATSVTFDGVADGGGYTVDVDAHTPGGDQDSGPSNAFDIYQGNYIVDNPPTIDTISCTGGDLTVTWTSNAADVTGYDVTLYDVNGNVIEDLTAPADATSVTFDDVADGGGYTVDVDAHTPGGDEDSGPSNPFDIYLGNYIVDNPPTITSVNGTSTPGTIVVTWTSNAADATGYDVIVYDDNGNVVADDVVDASALSDTISSIPDGVGYTVTVVAHTPGGDYDSDSSAPFDFAGGTFSNDAPVTIDSQSCTGGTYVITWTSNAADVNGYDVILYDANGDVVADVTEPADATSATIPNVADGDGYTVAVVAHTPVGDLTSTTMLFDISGGSLELILPTLEFGSATPTGIYNGTSTGATATGTPKVVQHKSSSHTHTGTAIGNVHGVAGSNVWAWAGLGVSALALVMALTLLVRRRLVR